MNKNLTERSITEDPLDFIKHCLIKYASTFTECPMEVKVLVGIESYEELSGNRKFNQNGELSLMGEIIEIGRPYWNVNPKFIEVQIYG